MAGIYADALEAVPETMDGQPPMPLERECPVTLDDLLSPPRRSAVALADPRCRPGANSTQARRGRFTRFGCYGPNGAERLTFCLKVLLTEPHLQHDNPQKIRRRSQMSNVEQFQKAVTDAGAVAMRIMRRPNGAERLVIQTPGGLITREVPLRGDLGKDV